MIQLLVSLVVVGVLLWAVNTYVPMAQPVRGIFNVVVVIFLLVWVLRVFGLWGGAAYWH